MRSAQPSERQASDGVPGKRTCPSGARHEHEGEHRERGEQDLPRRGLFQGIDGRRHPGCAPVPVDAVSMAMLSATRAMEGDGRSTRLNGVSRNERGGTAAARVASSASLDVTRASAIRSLVADRPALGYGTTTEASRMRSGGSAARMTFAACVARNVAVASRSFTTKSNGVPGGAADAYRPAAVTAWTSAVERKGF